MQRLIPCIFIKGCQKSLSFLFSFSLKKKVKSAEVNPLMELSHSEGIRMDNYGQSSLDEVHKEKASHQT